MWTEAVLLPLTTFMEEPCRPLPQWLRAMLASVSPPDRATARTLMGVCQAQGQGTPCPLQKCTAQHWGGQVSSTWGSPVKVGSSTAVPPGRGPLCTESPGMLTCAVTNGRRLVRGSVSKPAALLRGDRAAWPSPGPRGRGRGRAQLLAGRHAPRAQVGKMRLTALHMARHSAKKTSPKQVPAPASVLTRSAPPLGSADLQGQQGGGGQWAFPGLCQGWMVTTGGRQMPS